MDLMEIEDDTYINTNLTMERLISKVDFQRRKQPSRCRRKSVCLGLLCVVLLAGNIGQIIYYEIISRPASVDPAQASYTLEKLNNTQENRLQRSYDALTAEKKQLETSYKLLWKDKEKFQNSYKIVKSEKEQLQTNYSSLATSQEQLQKKIDKVRRNMVCQTGWRKFDISCYLVTTLEKNWTLSRQDCIAKGADLAIIDSREEQVFVNGLLKSGYNAWIGLSDSLEEGTWVWLDGTPVTIAYWQPGQPNSFNRNQDCGEIVQKEGGGEWNDDGCFAEQLGICEK
ncbi:C-type lectin domain family 17, member A Prolectin [Larimichthys crocea]|uniref:C-type lectin domain family 17, member A Prolectin n=1 Tax=Larimichthys crocea TaxID=215358 RepID=A0A6G0I2V0_LARCR|nr:C-type lectin domain family 17, member A Prolectin [Larimichthys crocea]